MSTKNSLRFTSRRRLSTRINLADVISVFNPSIKCETDKFIVNQNPDCWTGFQPGNITLIKNSIKYPLGDCVSKENYAYVGLTTTTLCWLTMHLNDSSSVVLHLKIHSIPKSKFRKIFVENSTIIAHEINKLRLQILQALLIKTKF